MVELTDTSASSEASLIASYFSDWTEVTAGKKYSRDYTQADYYTLTEAYHNFCIQVGEEAGKTITVKYTLQNDGAAGTEQQLEFSYTYTTVSRDVTVGVGEIDSADSTLTTGISTTVAATTTTTVTGDTTNAPFDTSAPNVVTAETTAAVATAPGTGRKRMRRRINDEYFSAKTKDLAFRTRRAIKVEAGATMKIDDNKVTVQSLATPRSQVFEKNQTADGTIYQDGSHLVTDADLVKLMNDFLAKFNGTNIGTAQQNQEFTEMVREFIHESHREGQQIQQIQDELISLLGVSNSSQVSDRSLSDIIAEFDTIGLDATRNDSHRIEDLVQAAGTNIAANMKILKNVEETEKEIISVVGAMDSKLDTGFSGISSSLSSIESAVIKDLAGKLPNKNFTSHLDTILSSQDTASQKYEEILTEIRGMKASDDNGVIPSGDGRDDGIDMVGKTVLEILKAVQMIQVQLSQEHVILEHHITGGDKEEGLIKAMNAKLTKAVGDLEQVSASDSLDAIESKISAQIAAIQAFQHNLNDSDSSGVVCKGSDDLTETTEGKVLISTLSLSAFVATISFGYMMMRIPMNLPSFGMGSSQYVRVN